MTEPHGLRDICESELEAGFPTELHSERSERVAVPNLPQTVLQILIGEDPFAERGEAALTGAISHSAKTRAC